MVEIEIDGQKIEVPPGSMLMEAANKIGTYIPHFCYHKKLSIAANCRMCLVDVEKAPKPLPACATPVANGMVVRSHSEKAVKAQKNVMEFLLINHPLDCPICDQGGECQLQDLAVGYGEISSRYKEEKRVVFHKNVGALISMQEMSRCIHCTRCVRFGQEIAGVMELGMVNRGEHSEITTFVGQTVDSELSGNMIDLCPVGALTSKPFRYSARTWELQRRKSVSPHDGLGANLIVQIKGEKVLRVVPLENEAVNECWISDKDRFSYEALNSQERLAHPMIKQDGKWIEADWQTALEYVAHGLRNIRHEHGPDSIHALATPHSTLEELALLKKVVSGLGSGNIDFRLRQNNFELDGEITPWLGMPIADVNLLEYAFVVGSYLRKDHPLLAARLRTAVREGASMGMLHACDDDSKISITEKIIVAPSQWLAALAEIVCYVAQQRGVAPLKGCEVGDISEVSKTIAKKLMFGERRAIFLGNILTWHPQYTQLHTVAQWLAENTGATLGYLTEAANTVGAHLLALKSSVAATQSKAGKAYLLLNTEPDFDCAEPARMRVNLAQSDMVVVMSCFKHGMDYADVFLPIAPFTETGGTFVNCEGRAQSFNGVVRPLGQTRPGWKVLRVLGNLLGLENFNYETFESVRDEILGAQGNTDVSQRLNNKSSKFAQIELDVSTALQRLPELPIHFADAVVRRAESLQATHDAQTPKAYMAPTLMQRIGIKAGEFVKVNQGQGSALLAAEPDVSLSEMVVRVATGHVATVGLGSTFGELSVERA